MSRNPGRWQMHCENSRIAERGVKRRRAASGERRAASGERLGDGFHLGASGGGSKLLVADRDT